jgi:hypothetical protein
VSPAGKVHGNASDTQLFLVTLLAHAFAAPLRRDVPMMTASVAATSNNTTA